MIETVGGRVPLPREPWCEPGCSSIYTAVPFAQDLAYLAIGERTNANGSRKFREAMLAGDWDTCVQMAREQVKEGAHVLDVCVDYVGRDGVADMHEIAGRFATAGRPAAGARLDRAARHGGRPAAHRRAGRPQLRQPGGRAGARLRFDRVFALAREYGAAVICLTIDEEGQARTADWKVRVAKRIHDLAIERVRPGAGRPDLRRPHVPPRRRPGGPAPRRHRDDRGHPPHQGGVARRLHRASGSPTSASGSSPAIRQALNSVFLHECVEAGLDAAIVHAARILPMHKIDDRARELCLDLIYDRRRRRATTRSPS